MPDGVPAPQPRRPGRGAVRSLRHLHRPRLLGRCVRRRARRRAVTPRPSRRRDHAAATVADRARLVERSHSAGRASGRRPRPRPRVRPRLGRAAAPDGRRRDAGRPGAARVGDRRRRAAQGLGDRRRTAGRSDRSPSSASIRSATGSWSRSLATRIAEIGRLPLLGAVTTPLEPAGGRANSAHRVRALVDDITVPPSLADAVAGARRTGAARRRLRRLRVDDGPRGPGTAAGRRAGRAAARACHHDLTGPPAVASRSATGASGGPAVAVDRRGADGGDLHVLTDARGMDDVPVADVDRDVVDR